MRSDLYPPSCSSSTTISDGSSGAKTAVRVPTTTRASPRRIRHHSSCRSPPERPEWRTASWSPTTDRSRSAICGIRLTSGTSTIAPPPSRERLLDRGEVHVGLARGRDALEQELAARRAARRSRRGRRAAPARARCGAATSWPGARAGRARRCATRARRGPTPPAAAPGARRLAGSISSASARSGIVALAVAERLEDRPLDGRATRRLGVRAHRARTTRTRRAETSGGRSDHSARIAPDRRSCSSQAVRPRRGAWRCRLASPILPSSSTSGREVVRAARPRPRRPSVRTTRDSRPGGSIAASVVPIGAR